MRTLKFYFFSIIYEKYDLTDTNIKFFSQFSLFEIIYNKKCKNHMKEKKINK